jgi:peptidoglycan/xylan/chitin deacetylase (PgdA/CDA1 family)
MIRKLKYLVPLVVLMAVSCTKDFLDINTDPNNPTSIEVSKLLSTAQRTLGDALSMDENNGGLSEILAVYTHQMTTREEADKYGITGVDPLIQTSWSKLFSQSANPGSVFPVYGVLQNLEDIIRNATAAGNMRYAGIAKVMKAYTFSQLVDVFGDIPFTEANKLKEGILYPKFDDDAAIYDSLFLILDAGIADLTNSTAPNTLKPGTDDLIYGGNMGRWVKAANTIKLKLYTQIRKVEDVSAEVSSLLSSGNLISQTNESFLIPYGPNSATDDRNPGFFTYFATQRSNHVSPWFYEIMKGYNPNIFTWDEARNLARRGFTIGAHSLHHAILTRETEASALSDIELSIAEVSSEIGTPCKTFAFPNGNYTARLAKRALEAGAQTVMTTDPMWADNSFPPWRLPRVSLSGAYNRAAIELKMALATGRWLLNPNGTGRLYRKRAHACETADARW